MRSEDIARLLPTAYQRAAGRPGVLATLLETMEQMHAPTLRTLRDVEDLFTPYRSPDRMVPYLLSWVALDHVLSPAIPIGRLRDLVALGAAIARRRGTAAGLQTVLVTATDVPVTVEESADIPFHIVVRLPASASELATLVRRIVEAEKPAAVTAEVIVG